MLRARCGASVATVQQNERLPCCRARASMRAALRKERSAYCDSVLIHYRSLNFCVVGHLKNGRKLPLGPLVPSMAE